MTKKIFGDALAFLFFLVVIVLIIALFHNQQKKNEEFKMMINEHFSFMDMFKKKKKSRTVTVVVPFRVNAAVDKVNCLLSSGSNKTYVNWSVSDDNIFTGMLPVKFVNGVGKVRIEGEGSQSVPSNETFTFFGVDGLTVPTPTGNNTIYAVSETKNKSVYYKNALHTVSAYKVNANSYISGFDVRMTI